MLSHDECVDIMELDVVMVRCEKEIYGEQHGITKTKNNHPLDSTVCTHEFFQKAYTELDEAHKNEMEKLKFYTNDLKIGLDRKLDILKNDIGKLENIVENSTTVAEKLLAQKDMNLLKKELKQREQNLFLDGLRLEQEMENKVKNMVDNSKLTAEVKREFVVEFIGGVK